MLHTQEAASSSLAAPTISNPCNPLEFRGLQGLTQDASEGSTSGVSGQDVALRSHYVTNSVTSLPDDLVQLSDGSVVPLRGIFQRRAVQVSVAVERRRQWLFLNGPCQHCGSWERLEVDHVDPGEKEVEATQLWCWEWSRRREELSKCQVLCYLCHKVKHASAHGTSRRYKALGCRCGRCQAAHAEKARKERAARASREAAQCQKSE